MRKLNLNEVRKFLEGGSVRGNALANLEALQHLQTAAFVMCGGGMLGRMAAEQPADFYIDDRVGGLPYPKLTIEQTVSVLCVLADVLGLDAHRLPARRDFHACGIF